MLNQMINLSNRQYSTKSDKYNHTRLFAIYFAIIIATSILASCASDNPDYNFRNCDDALKVYMNFHKKLQSKEKMNSEELQVSLAEWTNLADTVFHYLEKDSAFKAHVYVSDKYYAIHDSIRTEMYRLATSQKRTLKDVFLIKHRSSIYNNDKDFEDERADGERFFASLDSKTPDTRALRQTLKSYRDFLVSVKNVGVNDEEQLKAVLQEEDLHFRAFLKVLDKLGSESVTDITSMTEDICKTIYLNATDGKLDGKKTLVMMSMRTNRRLLQNAQACIEAIRKGQELTSKQHEAYFFMMIHPYIAIDPFGMSMLTDKQTKELEDMADVIHRLESTHKIKGEHRDLTDMCHLILKFYITSI